MPALPGTLALTGIADGALITAVDHRNNYTALQAAVNALIADLGGAAAGALLQGLSSSSIGYLPDAPTDKQALLWDAGTGRWRPGGGYTAYAPTWTSTGVAPALGNGTIAGQYLQIGKLVQAHIVLTLGSTSTVGTGTYVFSLPVTTAPALSSNDPVGTATLFDTSAAALFGRFAVLGGSGVTLIDASGVFFGAAAPFVPAVGDQVWINVNYQAA